MGDYRNSHIVLISTSTLTLPYISPHPPLTEPYLTPFQEDPHVDALRSPTSLWEVESCSPIDHATSAASNWEAEGGL